MRLTTLCLLCCAATHSACSASSDDPPGLEEIIERSVEAMGDQAALESVESVFRQRNDRMFTLRKRPNFQLVVLLNDSGGVRYAEGYDGEAAWELTDDGPKTRTSERAQTALWHSTQWPGILKPLSHMGQLGHTLELLGPDTVQGIAYYKLLLRLSDGFEREYYVNARTYRIERSRDARRFHAYEDEVQPIEGIWSDFREIHGVWAPFTTAERNFQTGEHLSGGTMRQIKLNVSVPDEVFTLNGSLEPFLQLIRELTLPASTG